MDNHTTHIVIKFNEKNKHGKQSIDVVPIAWTYFKKGKLYCKYPSELEYHNIDEMNKTSSVPGALWKSYEVISIKEARTYFFNLIMISK